MTARAGELSEVEVLSLHTEGPAPYAAPERAGSFDDLEMSFRRT